MNVAEITAVWQAPLPEGFAEWLAKQLPRPVPDTILYVLIKQCLILWRAPYPHARPEQLPA